MPIAVEGLRDKVRALERAGAEVEDLKDAMGAVAKLAADTMAGFAPSKTGALRASIRGNRAKGKAVVTAGKARVRYAGPINYGWAARNIAPANFIAKTDKVMETKAAQLLEDGINDILTRENLT